MCIVRYKETFEEIIQKVAELKCSISIKSFESPLKVSQVITYEIKERAHFIPLLYKFEADIDLDPKIKK